MSITNGVAKSYSAAEFVCGDNLVRADVTVGEVFRMMFGFEISPVLDSALSLSQIEANDKTAIIGFSGSMRGSCHVRITSEAARAITSAMLGGAPVTDDDESIDDALGELCNMLAGGWKNSVPELSSTCALSPPTVISGHDYKVYVRKPSARLCRVYAFDHHLLYLILHCEELE